MEMVDFDTKRTEAPREHAGRAAYMFSDLDRARPERVAPISIVRLPATGYEDENVFYGMKMLHAESEVVVWTDAAQREQFIEERRRIAVEGNGAG